MKVQTAQPTWVRLSLLGILLLGFGLAVTRLGYQELTGRLADYVEIYELDDQRQKRRSVDEEFIDDVRRDVRAAAAALRRNELPPKPDRKTCGRCDYCNLCSSALPAQEG